MEQQNYQYQDQSVFVQQEGSVSKKFFANVFMWMFFALTISTVMAYVFGNVAEFRDLLIRVNPETGKYGTTVLGMVLMFAPLGLVLLMSAGLARLSYPVLLGVFILYAALTGASLSIILFTYTATSVLSCFIGATGIFGIMAFLGYTTNIDLSKFGPILMVGLIGLVIATVVNMFVQSEQFSLMLAYLGIAIFTALTAYDVQNIKRIGMGIEQAGDQVLTVDAKKMAIMGALRLYLDFLNIFLYLLQIFGSRK